MPLVPGRSSRRPERGSILQEMLRVYLDQNKWIDLVRAGLNRPGGARFRDVLTLAEEGVRRGFTSFPLSSIHYIETYNKRDAHKRWELAQGMARVSRFHAIAPHNVILPREIDVALNRRFGLPVEPRSVRTFGLGIGHAFDQPDLAFPGALNSDLGSEREEYLWELVSLAGPLPDRPVPPDVDMEGFKAVAREFQAFEDRLTRTFKSEALSRERRKDYLAFGEVSDILAPLNEAFERAGITDPGALSKGGEMTEFLEDLPSRAVPFALRQLRHDNPQDKWDRRDMNDLGALGLAVPYCDVVVTEKRWADALARLKFDEKYETEVLSDLANLAPRLAVAA